MNSPFVIGIAGGSGSGKTRVTKNIAEKLGREDVLVIQHDAYYRDISTFGGLSPAEVNFDHPDSLETDLLVSHLQSLRTGRNVEMPKYDFGTHRRAGSSQVEPRRIILIDGILILSHTELRSVMDLKVYVDTEADERLMRRIRRDISERRRSLDSILMQYELTVKPMHLQFVEPSKHWADVIIPRGGDNPVVIDLLVKKIMSVLNT